MYDKAQNIILGRSLQLGKGHPNYDSIQTKLTEYFKLPPQQSTKNIKGLDTLRSIRVKNQGIRAKRQLIVNELNILLNGS